MSHEPPSISATEVQKRPLYELSTQFRNWRFSPEHLVHLRFSLNAAAVSAIRHTLESEKVYLSVLLPISNYVIILSQARPR